MTNDDIINAITAIIAIASFLANVLPNDSDNKYVSILIKLVRVIAFNINVKGIK
jgi:hypothetical protein